MSKKILFLLFLFILFFTGCSSIKYQITESKNQNLIVFLNNFDITGSVLSDTDKELVYKNVIFYIEKNKFVINDEDNDNYKINFRLDVRPIGFNLFLMREMNNVFIEVEVLSRDYEPLYKITSNSKIFYSAHDLSNLRRKIDFNILSACSFIKSDIKDKEKNKEY
jgi:hypothetical protein